MVSKGFYLSLNTININAYHKLPTFFRGTTRKVLFMLWQNVLRGDKVFFPTILFVLEEMEKGEIVLEFWAMQGEPKKLADDKFPHA